MSTSVIKSGPRYFLRLGRAARTCVVGLVVLKASSEMLPFLCFLAGGVFLGVSSSRPSKLLGIWSAWHAV